MIVFLAALLFLSWVTGALDQSPGLLAMAQIDAVCLVLLGTLKLGVWAGRRQMVHPDFRHTWPEGYRPHFSQRLGPKGPPPKHRPRPVSGLFNPGQPRLTKRAGPGP